MANSEAAKRMGTAFETYLNHKPANEEDVQKAFTFGCGYAAGQTDMKPQLDELVRLLSSVMEVSDTVRTTPLGEEIEAALARHQPLATTV